MDVWDATRTAKTGTLELVYPQWGRQRVERRSRWPDEAVDVTRAMLAGDGYVWAGITVRLQPNGPKGGDPGGFAWSVHYEGEPMFVSALCTGDHAADRFWRYAMMFKPTRIFEAANEGRPLVTRPASAPWMTTMYAPDMLLIPKADRHLWRLMGQTNLLVAGLDGVRKGGSTRTGRVFARAGRHFEA